MIANCEACGKEGKQGTNMMPNRVEGMVVYLCRKCEDKWVHGDGNQKTSLLDKLRRKS